MGTQTRRLSLRTVKDKELRQDLLGFQEKALELGASAAEVVAAADVVVQERVWMKCLVPRCGSAGLSPNCPPNTPQPDFMRKVFSQYQWALVFRRDVGPVEDYIPTTEARRDELVEKLRPRGFVHGPTWELVGRLESHIQSKGYDLAMAFSAGSCKACLCGNAPCPVLQDEACRHPLKARPSMEGVGIDVFDLASKVGWDAYMIRVIEPDLSEIPRVLSVGIVFVY